jgi:hypothetical protein
MTKRSKGAGFFSGGLFILALAGFLVPLNIATASKVCAYTLQLDGLTTADVRAGLGTNVISSANMVCGFVTTQTTGAGSEEYAKRVTLDVPDMPATAIKLPSYSVSGEVCGPSVVAGGAACTDTVLVAGNSNNWYARGTSLNNVKRDYVSACDAGECPTILLSPFDSVPSHFQGKIWVQSLKWMPNSSTQLVNANAINNTINAFIHNEFHGELYTAKDDVDPLGENTPTDICADAYTVGADKKCWYAASVFGDVGIGFNANGSVKFNGVTFPTSGGKYRHVIAAPPYAFTNGEARRGSFSPKVIYSHHQGTNTSGDPWLYMYAFVSTADLQTDPANPMRLGQCLLRASTANEFNWYAYETGGSPPTLWSNTKRVGSMYSEAAAPENNAFVDRYGSVTGSAYYNCEQLLDVNGDTLGLMTSVVWSTTRSKYVAVFDRGNNGTTGPLGTRDIISRWSSNLYTWDAPTVLLDDVPSLAKAADAGENALQYFSLLDDNGGDVNYESVDDNFYLYYTSYNLKPLHTGTGTAAPIEDSVTAGPLDTGWRYVNDNAHRDLKRVAVKVQ